MTEGLAVTVDDYTLPVAEVLAGRGFITGKSGSGKSNTASVVIEELLDAGRPVLIIDADGEYFGLREEYDLLCVGKSPECDRKIGPEHADALAELALVEHVPIILDVSEYSEGESRDLVAAVVGALFERERELRIPFLLVVEEVHEFMPEGRGLDSAGEALVRVAKRGRKRGLGLLGISQRPAAVDKDFITQCDWLVWHRLTWANDTRVVKNLLGSEAAETVENLETGEGLFVADWEDEPRRLRFREKRTYDAGATPDLDGGERPELRSPDASLLAALDDAGRHDGSDRASARPTENSSTDSDSGGNAGSGEPEETPRKRPTRSQSVSETQGGPLWELGQLVVYLFVATWRGVVGGCRWTAGQCRRLLASAPETETESSTEIDAERSER